MTVDVFLDLALKVATLGLSVGAMLVAVIRTRRKDVDGRLERANERFTEGARRMDRIDGRLTNLETTVEAMPGKDDVHSLQMTLAEMRGDLKAQNATLLAMAESLKRTESIVTRHEDHLRGTKS